MTPHSTTLSVTVPSWLDLSGVAWPGAAAAVAGLLALVALLALVVLGVRRIIRAAGAAVAAGRITTRRVLIVVAVLAALAVAGIGGVRSFDAVSTKFDSSLVPLVADGMIIACTALRLAALTRGWRIPGALVTTYLFIGGTVWLNVDTATGVVDAVAHALAPIAYAVLVEMLAHLLRLHLKLSQPARPKLSALTWFTSPVITTRVWLHLSRTGSSDPAEARALIQQVVRMASRLATLCPSRRLWPFDAARAARTACLHTIRDGLLTAAELAALLPATGRLVPGELLALVDSAALGLAHSTPPGAPDRAEVVYPGWLVGYALATLHHHATRDAEPEPREDPDLEPDTAWMPSWMVGYVFGALHHRTDTDHSDGPETAPTAPVHSTPHQQQTAPVRRTDRTSAPAPVHHADCTSAPAPVHQPAALNGAVSSSVISAPVAESSKNGAGPARSKRTDDEYVAELLRVSAEERGGAPLTQREIARLTGVGSPRARRLAGRCGWVQPTDVASGDRAGGAGGAHPEPDSSTAPTLGGTHAEGNHPDSDHSPNLSIHPEISLELESSSHR